MSWGYVPKKLKYARRQRRARKKWKNFSCSTCRNRKFFNKRYVPTLPIGLIVTTFQNCPDWKANKESKLVDESNAKTQLTLGQRIKLIFK